MANNFTKLTQEDFQWHGLAQNIEVDPNDSTKDRINILSRFADKAANHVAIENFDAINMGLTPIYAMDNNEGDRFSLCLDHNSLGGNARDPYDRYVWSGAVEQVRSSKDSIFTHTSIDGTETDGHMVIPQPFWKNYQADREGNRAAATVKIQFGNLPAFTWVPLFGWYSSGYGATQYVWSGANSSIIYGSTGYNPYWDHTLSSDDQNLYSGSSNAYETTAATHAGTSYTRNLYALQASYLPFGTWFIWCHDGNGNAMLATCGETKATANPQSDDAKYFPTNSQYGVANGYTKFQAPYFLRNWVQTKGNTALTQLWDGPASTSWEGRTQDTLNWYTQDRVWNMSPQLDQLGTDHNALRIWTLVQQSFRLIAYGPTANADLSTPTTMHIFGDMIRELRDIKSGMLINHSGANTYGNEVWSHANFLTGKIGDFTFQNVCINAGNETPYSRAVLSGDPKHAFQALVLRPTVVGDGKIHSFSFGSYEAEEDFEGDFDVPTDGVYSNVGSNANGTSGKTYIQPKVGCEFLFPSDGGSYDPVTAAAVNSALLQDSTGDAMDTVTDPPWTTANFLLDDNLSTKAVIKKIGTENALFIKLNNAASGSSIADADTITDFVVTVRGITQVIVGNYRVMFALTDDQKTIKAQTNATTAITAPLKGSSANNPEGGGNYTVHFSSTQLGGTTYANIKDGYLKIWAEDAS